MKAFKKSFRGWGYPFDYLGLCIRQTAIKDRLFLLNFSSLLSADRTWRADQRRLVPGRDLSLHVGFPRNRSGRLAQRRRSGARHLHHRNVDRRRRCQGSQDQDQELDLRHLLRGGRHLRSHHRYRFVRTTGDNKCS